jgi:hypothetical protein
MARAREARWTPERFSDGHALHTNSKAKSGATLVAAVSVRTPLPPTPFSDETLAPAFASR